MWSDQSEPWLREIMCRWWRRKLGNSWAKSLRAGGQCEKWAGGGLLGVEEEEEEEEEEECSTWAATTCSPVAGQPGTGHCPRAPTPAFQSLARFAQHYTAPTKYYIAPHCIKYLTLHFVTPYCIALHNKIISNHTAFYMYIITFCCITTKLHSSS